MDLKTLGWNSRFEKDFEPYAAQGLVPARIIAGQRDLCTVVGVAGELLAEVSGKFRNDAQRRADYPVVGDWVAIAPRVTEGRAIIHALLGRASSILRLDANAKQGKAEEQVVAANVDAALIVMGLDHDFNVRRLERYLTLAWGSGVHPIVALNKADLCDSLSERTTEAQEAAIGVPVLDVSAETGDGVETLAALLAPGKTTALMGSSGVGKSTLINRLLGTDRMATGGVRKDDQRGRHTTTHRELVILPSGALLIDNPGMREVGLWADEEDLGAAFSDIEEWARACRFSDCRHGGEPGCAVRAALEDGRLEGDRYDAWRKLQRELAFLARRDDMRETLAQRQMLKNRAKHMKGFRKDRRA